MLLIDSCKSYYRSVYGSQVLTIDTKTRTTRGIFANKKAYILAAGPSLNAINFRKLEDELRHSLVICIKQSYLKLKEFNINHLCDMHLLNFCNHFNYDWENHTCPTGWVFFDEKHPQEIRDRNDKCSSYWNVINNGSNTAEGFLKSMAGSSNWSNIYNIGKGEVHWGPGLMYELAIPLAALAGCNEIILCGWDIGTLANNNNANLNSHFYNNEDLISSSKTKMSDLEMEVVAKSTKNLYKWFLDHSINLSLISSQSLADPCIPRKNNYLY